MKILVHNYSSEASTEPLYLTQAAKSRGIEASMWNSQTSAFDAFDKANPDVFLTHYAVISKDAVKRLKGAGITTAVNVTGASQQHLDQIKENIDDVFFFSNFKMNDDTPVVAPAADVFMGNRENPMPEYAIETLFVVDNQMDIDQVDHLFDTQESYHIISTSKNFTSEEVDGNMSIDTLCFIYDNYENVIVTKPTQVFYDAAYYRGTCGMVNSSAFLKKEVVESSHTPYNRLDDLLEYIGKFLEEKGHKQKS